MLTRSLAEGIDYVTLSMAVVREYYTVKQMFKVPNYFSLKVNPQVRVEYVQVSLL